ncbi:hypothetical protein Ahy_A08g038292 isoform C [Arachis hypogaea]|uniref:Non-haem dioxygenase N-terminal domain-containing protein n=1 Tax=Arachis hypogaea TaxID=3818 RepID=A0A445BT93_ARAHY|nr:hypothetical protein Ahy_A08g038292 isoform C [Arachis hypogaea]
MLVEKSKFYHKILLNLEAVKFFYRKDSAWLIKRLQEVGKEFFALPQKEKEPYANDSSNENFEGHGTKMTKNHEEKVEWVDYFFHMMAPSSKANYDKWLKNPPSYRFVINKLN